ncbi:MAG: hypothetical protein EHM23_24180 [Acidobacteria bacterium]|nr:MAG: hypothetical protein EHM23_24180 [Acidobacteriota bacterium]
MRRNVFLLLCLMTAIGLVLAADGVTGSWEGSFQTQDGFFGALTAEVNALPDGTYKAMVAAADQGVQFELPGKKQEDKVAFAGTIQVSPEIGSLDIQAEIANGKFSGTFKGTTYSGTFELKRPEKKPAD